MKYPMKEGCRYCWHAVTDHNLEAGCPHCTCMATLAEAISPHRVRREAIPADHYRGTMFDPKHARKAQENPQENPRQAQASLSRHLAQELERWLAEVRHYSRERTEVESVIGILSGYAERLEEEERR